MRVHNFSAGPGTLPFEVLEEVQNEITDYKGTGTSIVEMSHRSKAYSEVAESARTQLRQLLGLNEDWHILFLQGGASLQFYQVPLNFLHTRADYLDTGSWSSKAIKEGKLVGDVNVAASSKDDSYTFIPEPDTWQLSDKADYVHYTSNNTIYGTQFAYTPDVNCPLVCDASSDFLSRPIDMDKFGLIYAGAQKNIGPAGTTVVLVHDSFLNGRRSGVPTLLDYGTHAAKLFHTPPVFAVYMVEKVLRWLTGLGGLSAIESINRQKATTLYDRIDRTEFYRGTARADSRSRMNVTFRVGSSEELEAQFVADAAKSNLTTLKGHRSVGGIRASIYNACSQESVDTLVSFMDEFERTNG